MKKSLLISMLLVSLLLPARAQEISPADIASARKIRRAELSDPIRPSWHLTIPEGTGMPFDPNGAIFHKGIYHLWYLYQDNDRHHWQHLTSLDLFHWRWHLNDLMPRPGDPDDGIFSGNAFLAADGNVVIAYHGLGTEGNCVAFSSDSLLENWTKPAANPIAKPGWDPHMWLEDGKYLMISGGPPVASGQPNPPLLYSGTSYEKPLSLVGPFLSKDMPDVDDFEDISCPDFFRMDDKWVLVCISHIRGARYYIGSWDGKQFTPESHQRMNWPGGTCFAPETLLDDKGRRIFWAWVLDRKSGVSSGTMTMPRVLSLSKDKKSLLIEPPKEIKDLRYGKSEEKPFTVNAGKAVTLANTRGYSMEIDVTIDPGQAKRFGIKVFCSADGRENTPVIIDRDRNILSVDMRKSSLEKPEYREFVVLREPNPLMDTQDAPFTLARGEKLELKIFLDKSMLEVFANDRQCLTQVIYPTLGDAVNVQVFADDAPVKVLELKSWKIFPAMQW